MKLGPGTEIRFVYKDKGACLRDEHLHAGMYVPLYAPTLVVYGEPPPELDVDNVDDDEGARVIVIDMYTDDD